MKSASSKNIALIILAVAVIIALLFAFFDFSEFEFRVSMKKYHTIEVDGKEFSFYGGFGKINRVKVEKEGKKLCTLKISADADAFEAYASAVELCDVNADGEKDLLLLTVRDEDGDVHRSLYISSEGGYVWVEDVDIVNFRSDDENSGVLVSEERRIRYLAETVEEYVVPYEDAAVRVEYKYIGGSVVPARTLIAAYYTETDIYCVGEWEYSEEHGESVPVGEDWMSPTEYSALREELSKKFTIAIP